MDFLLWAHFSATTTSWVVFPITRTLEHFVITTHARTHTSIFTYTKPSVLEKILAYKYAIYASYLFSTKALPRCSAARGAWSGAC